MEGSDMAAQGEPDAGAEVPDGETLGVSDGVKAYLGDAYDRVAHYAEMLRDQGELRGLIGPREVSRIWERHILNSAAVVPYLPTSGSVADIGSGAGLPGVVIAAMRPELDVILVEPMERRTTWLAEVVSELGLTNVEIKRGRAEEYHGAFEVDVVTSRAVAALSKLVRLSMPLVRVGGEMVILKGRSVTQEIEPARKVLQKYGSGVPDVLDGVTVAGVEATAIVRVRRAK
ncbi:16S rRNA (guanine(527)-N(7))-methyltransferase RsmG [Promicromonospora xylanilytica]